MNSTSISGSATPRWRFRWVPVISALTSIWALLVFYDSMGRAPADVISWLVAAIAISVCVWSSAWRFRALLTSITVITLVCISWNLAAAATSTVTYVEDDWEIRETSMRITGKTIEVVKTKIAGENGGSSITHRYEDGKWQSGFATFRFGEGTPSLTDKVLRTESVWHEGPVTQSGKQHGEWSETTPVVDADGTSHWPRRKLRWYWYGEEVSEGDWNLRNR